MKLSVASGVLGEKFHYRRTIHCDVMYCHRRKRAAKDEESVDKTTSLPLMAEPASELKTMVRLRRVLPPCCDVLCVSGSELVIISTRY